MGRALALARAQKGRTGSNPAVGCVVLNAQGHMIAEAATGDGGRPHAEQLALDHLAEGAALNGTVYVTLEPCRERSTGEASCSERLLAAGIARVVCAARDAHPKGAGGFRRLQEAGVPLFIGLKRDASRKINPDFAR